MRGPKACAFGTGQGEKWPSVAWPSTLLRGRLARQFWWVRARSQVDYGETSGRLRGEFRLKYGTFLKKVPYFFGKSTVHFAKSTVLLADVEGGGR